MYLNRLLANDEWLLMIEKSKLFIPISKNYNQENVNEI